MIDSIELPFRFMFEIYKTIIVKLSHTIHKNSIKSFKINYREYIILLKIILQYK